MADLSTAYREIRQVATSTRRWDTALAICSAIVAAYAIVAYAILDTSSFPTIDVVVKTLQARALLSSHFTSLTLPYYGRSLDPGYSFFPMTPPHTFPSEAGWHGIFPTGVALFNAPLLLFGMRGITLGSIVSSFVVLMASARLTTVEPRWGVSVMLGLGTFLWGYAVLPWEHMPALALSTVAFLCLRWPSTRGGLVSGLVLGAAACLRDESLLLLPGLLYVCWRRAGNHRVLLALVLGLIVCPLGVALLDAAVYQRPVAAHLRHAVGAVERWLGVAPPAGLPYLTSLSWERRFDIVVHEWILGIRGGHVFATAAVTLGTLALLRRTVVALFGSALVVVILLVLHLGDLLKLTAAPEVVAGILRWSPIVVFALLPAARGARLSAGRREALVTMGCYTLGALCSVTTHGGFQLGPRLMLPILPFAGIAAWEGWMTYRYAPSSSRLSTFIFVAGGGLLLGSICMQLLVTQRAFVEFNRREQHEAQWMQASAQDAVVIDDSETVCVAGPVIDRQPVFLATSQARASALARMLAGAGMHSILFVSRERRQNLTFEPYTLASQHRTRSTTLQRWVLRPDASQGESP